MPRRYELENARLLKGWTEADVARRLTIKPSAETVRRWEQGTQTPRADIIGELCRLFNVASPKKLNLDAQFNASTQSREEVIAVYRREFFEYLPVGVGPTDGGACGLWRKLWVYFVWGYVRR